MRDILAKWIQDRALQYIPIYKYRTSLELCPLSQKHKNKKDENAVAWGLAVGWPQIVMGIICVTIMNKHPVEVSS